MEPVLIRFPKPLLAWLRSEAARREISVAEFVRRILDEKKDK